MLTVVYCACSIISMLHVTFDVRRTVASLASETNFTMRSASRHVLCSDESRADVAVQIIAAVTLFDAFIIEFSSF